MERKSCDPLSFCPHCGNMLIRCKCSDNPYKVNSVTTRVARNHLIIKNKLREVEFHSAIPKEFYFNYVSSINGFRGQYSFYETEDSIFCFCNNIMSIPTGILEKKRIFEISKDFLGRRIIHPTIKKKVALRYFDSYKQFKVGYMLQNAFLYLASIGCGKIQRIGHGLEFIIEDLYYQNTIEKDASKILRYVGSVNGYRKDSIYYLYESKNEYFLFSQKRLDLASGRIEKDIVEKVYVDYRNDTIDRVSTRVGEAKKYLEVSKEIDERKLGFKFQNIFYILVILKKAHVTKEGRTLIFDVI